MKIVNRVVISLFTLAIMLFNGCKSDFKPVTINSGFAVLSYPIYLGGDFMSGYTNGALDSAGQRFSIPYLLNQQLKNVGISTTYNQHFVAMPNGYGLNFPLTAPKFLTSFHLGNKTDCLGASSLFPLNDSISSNDANLNSELIFYRTGAKYSAEGIPYAKLIDFTDNSMGISLGRNPYFAQIALVQGVSTMLSDAIAQPFTFFVLWAGMEDIYQYAQRGGEGETLTDFATFDAKLDEVLDALIVSSQGPHGVIANIPDIDNFPFYNFIPWNGLVLTTDQANQLNSIFGTALHFNAGPNGFMIVDSANINFPYRHMNANDRILLTVPTDSLKCNYLGALGPVPGHYILDQNEMAKVNSAIQHFNAKIQSSAAMRNIPMVDMNAYFKQVKSGYYQDGIKFSADFIKGAFYSLDGYHPTAQGYGLLTNEFIKTINGFYHSNIPLVDITRLPGIVFP